MHAGMLYLCIGFGVFFYLGYYIWWPFIFLATTPLALASENRHVGWAACLSALVSAVTLVFVYRFFAVYSLLGLLLISGYHGLTIGCVVAATHAVRQWTRLPLAFVFPPLWTGGEYWRMLGEIGLPLGLLAPPAHGQLWMIQICDIGGLYLLSFFIAMVGAGTADWIRVHFRFSHQIKSGQAHHQGYIATLFLWGCIALYGHLQLDQASVTMTKGPMISVIQPDIPTRPESGFGFDPKLMLTDLINLSDQAMNEETKPDLLVWPEVPQGMPIFQSDIFGPSKKMMDEKETDFHNGETGDLKPDVSFYGTITDWVQRNDRPLIMGAFLEEPQFVMDAPRGRLRNAGICLEPSNSLPCQRQFKIRLFPVGEYLPWKSSSFSRWLLETAFEFQKPTAHLEISPGTHREILTFTSSAQDPAETPWRYAVSICNEIMFPEDAGIFLKSGAPEKPIDFVVNISNNGGFQRNHASIFHSLLLPFRAVEGRIGIARSSNTGISGFVKPTGEVYGEVVNDRGQRWTGLGAPELDLIKQIVELRRIHEGELSRNLPLRNRVEGMIKQVEIIRSTAGISGQSTQSIWVDQRQTFYSQTNDLLAKALCLLLWICCTFSVSQMISGRGLRRTLSTS